KSQALSAKKGIRVDSKSRTHSHGKVKPLSGVPGKKAQQKTWSNLYHSIKIGHSLSLMGFAGFHRKVKIHTETELVVLGFLQTGSGALIISTENLPAINKKWEGDGTKLTLVGS